MSNLEVVEALLSDEQLRSIQDLFWVIYADETKERVKVNEAAYEVLVALNYYRKALAGNYV